MKAKIRHIAQGSKILLRYFSTEQDWHRAGYWKRAYGIATHRAVSVIRKIREAYARTIQQHPRDEKGKSVEEVVKDRVFDSGFVRFEIQERQDGDGAR